MKQLKVQLGDRSYPIYIGQNLFVDSELLTRHINANKVMIVTNTVVAPLYLEQVKKSIESSGKQVDVTILPDGEQYKTLETLNVIFDGLLQHQHGRDTCIVALGGGVIGDMAGFAASCYQRGVDFIQLPTTLLAQVDSSVGGKTAVNHPLGKNMIGAFHQPKAVYIDINCLNTLAKNQFAAGMAEVIKYGIIWDRDFFDWLGENKSQVTELSSQSLTYLIARCCEIKAEVVSCDEKEHGVRALLNLGHTFGHAIESEQGYGAWLHGEAVAVGMIMAAKTSLKMGLIASDEQDLITQLITLYDLPTKHPNDMQLPEFLRHMAIDKKVIAGQLRFVLPTSIGAAELVANVTQETLKQVIVSD
ncbi:MAG: 3-dehydroquinate synthase [Gammaproteobacteria bacterium]|nr:3-dehydroquinate synthase [Gammaproteobacteria bacterium]